LKEKPSRSINLTQYQLVKGKKKTRKKQKKDLNVYERKI
jgi:hypothetical protein